MPHKVFWLERTDLVQVSLRRFSYSSDTQCPGSTWGHDASVVIVEDALRDIWQEPVAGDRERYRTRSELILDADPRWSAVCARCGATFGPADQRQVNAEQLYSGTPDGSLCTLRNPPIGAMWNAWWLPEWYRGPDGIALFVRTPGGDWHVDGEASNCTRPQREVREDGSTWLTGRTHYCWIRHGDPRTGNVHVDKAGNTCSAGAGSIQSGSYHGFLHHGHLT